MSVVRMTSDFDILSVVHRKSVRVWHDSWHNHRRRTEVNLRLGKGQGTKIHNLISWCCTVALMFIRPKNSQDLPRTVAEQIGEFVAC